MAESSFKPITSCVFPVAGLGTRFLPATRNIPKEMLPLIDRPIIEYGVEEAVATGCSRMIFITREGKESIRDYFLPSSELEFFKKNNENIENADRMRCLFAPSQFEFVTQQHPKGLADAVYQAKEAVLDEDYFGLMLPDDVVLAEPHLLAQLEKVRKQMGGSVLALERVPWSETHRYGIVEESGEVSGCPGVHRISGLVEKPKPGKAPSNLAIIGRYVLSSNVFGHIERIELGSNNEYQLTDALRLLIEEEPLWGVEYKGERLDCGTVSGWIAATVRMAMRDKELCRSVIEACEKEGYSVRQ